MPELSKPVSYVAEFNKGGLYQYETIIIGVPPNTATGIKRGSYSITLNSRLPTGSQVEKMASFGFSVWGLPSVSNL